MHASQFGALTTNSLVALGDGRGWHVPAVDAQRVLLFDVRRLSQPVFQWEHMMEYDPPHIVRLLGNDAATTTVVLANSCGAVHCCQYDSAIDRTVFPWDFSQRTSSDEVTAEARAHRTTTAAAASALHMAGGNVVSRGTLAAMAPPFDPPSRVLLAGHHLARDTAAPLRGLFVAALPQTTEGALMLTQLTESGQLHARPYHVAAASTAAAPTTAAAVATSSTAAVRHDARAATEASANAPTAETPASETPPSMPAAVSKERLLFELWSLLQSVDLSNTTERQVREQLEVTLGVKLTEQKQAIRGHIKSFLAGTLAEPPQPAGDGDVGRVAVSKTGGGGWRGRGWMRPGAPLEDAGVHHTFHGAPRVQGFVASGALWLVGSDALQPPLGATDENAAATR
jgi:hypothetical protein